MSTVMNLCLLILAFVGYFHTVHAPTSTQHNIHTHTHIIYSCEHTHPQTKCTKYADAVQISRVTSHYEYYENCLCVCLSIVGVRCWVRISNNHNNRMENREVRKKICERLI